MSYFLISLIGFTLFLSLKDEKNKKTKRAISTLYIAIAGVTFVYYSGEVIGEFIYGVIN